MNDLVALPLLRAMGWTLVHSLWQGGLLALLAAVTLRMARRRSPELRHAIASVALVLMVLTFVGTLGWITMGGDPLPLADVTWMVPVGEGRSAGGWSHQLHTALGPWMPWLFLGWALGFTLRLVQMGRALDWLYGPCLGSLEAPSEAWLARFEGLRIRCRVRMSVRLGISDQVDSLVVLGWLKPVVLVPAAAMLALSPEALEALLAHELAHIRRGDFLGNLMLAFAEAVLFYHPAIWWLSRCIRAEREHCCDDAAAAICGDPIFYASALVGLEELRIQPIPIPDLVPAASGGKLMSRIQRLLHPRTPRDLATPIVTLLPVLLLMAALAVATLSAASAPKAPPAGPPVEVDFKQVHLRHRPDPPPYPAEAKAAKIQGTVEVLLTIDTNGKVTEAKAISGPDELRAHAIEYASAWEFEPATLKGKPVAARFKLTLSFRLQ
jgi:TonB family protein